MRNFLPMIAGLVGMSFIGCAGSTLAHSPDQLGQGIGLYFPTPSAKFSKGKSPLSGQAVLTYPPFFPQQESSLCGIAAARMIVGYYGGTLDKEARLSLKKVARRMGGVSGQELKNLFKASGFRAAIFPGTWDRLKTGVLGEIDRGRPLIVMLKKGNESHYVVLDGYDPGSGLVILNDPAQGPVAFPIERFKRAWENSGRFALLAVPVGDDSSQ